jgi:hypothetical protein
MTRKVALLLLVVSLASLLGAAIATAAEDPTREEYVAEVEALCKPGAEATKRAVEGARADLKAERLDVAAGKFGKAAAILGSTVAKIAPVPRPSADAAKLAKWFGYVRLQHSYLQKLAAALRAEHRVAFQEYSTRFVHNGNLANRTVLPFGFNYCAYKPSRFG